MPDPFDEIAKRTLRRCQGNVSGDLAGFAIGRVHQVYTSKDALVKSYRLALKKS